MQNSGKYLNVKLKYLINSFYLNSICMLLKPIAKGEMSYINSPVLDYSLLLKFVKMHLKQ